MFKTKIGNTSHRKNGEFASKEYRDSVGRYTKEPFLQKTNKAIDSICSFLKKLYLTGLIMGFCYISILSLGAEIYSVGYVSPVIAQTALKQAPVSPSKVSTGTIREVTAYNAGDINQTDSSPCISANGENVCLALELGYKRCAANFVPLGTDLIIQHFGECKVTDRMNSRFPNRVDIAMRLDEYERAVKFGKQKLLVTIK